MTIWPIILDSTPDCLRGRSLLLTPLGADTLLAHLQAQCKAITPKAPVVLSATYEADYVNALQDAGAPVFRRRSEFEEMIAGCELSDALLIIDPRCLPHSDTELAAFVWKCSQEPQVAHQLVAFETGVSGTKEHVSLDSKGRVRGVLRYYEPATWPFIAGLAAILLPAASGVVGEELIPATLPELRQAIAARGVPSRDVPVRGDVLDLSDEHGLLVASEHFVLKATGHRRTGQTVPTRVGDGQIVHETTRIIGPVVVHANARIDAGATLIGPALIGAGAHVGRGATVVHAAVGPGCVVPPGAVLRDRLWFDMDNDLAPIERTASYRDYLARLTLEPRLEKEPPSSKRQAGIKRSIDALAAALGLAILSPILVVVAFAVWIESRGSIFYGQKREGVGGRVFKCWKFRTMSAGAHLAQRDLKAMDTMDGPHFKLSHDPRVTRAGRFLRATNLDELPQLFNVLVGDMSLVGPRPSPFRENQVCVPWREARLSVRPGITGLWQVCRHDRSSGDFHQWIEYDVQYVRHMSLLLDLKILMATVLTGGGKKPVPAEWLVNCDPAHADDEADVPADFRRRQPAHAPAAS